MFFSNTPSGCGGSGRDGRIDLAARDRLSKFGLFILLGAAIFDLVRTCPVECHFRLGHDLSLGHFRFLVQLQKFDPK